jgi:ubiquinone biosynthesis protein
MLYPQLDLWSTAKPFMERWMADQVGPNAFARRLRDTLPQLSEDLPEVPLLVHRVLRKAVDGELTLNWKSTELEGIRGSIERGNRHTNLMIFGGILVLGGILGAGTLAAPLGMNPFWILGGLGGTGLVLIAWVLSR